MSPSPKYSDFCSCCPYPGNSLHTRQNPGNILEAKAEENGKTGMAVASPEADAALQLPVQYQYPLPIQPESCRSRQHDSPGPSTVAHNWAGADHPTVVTSTPFDTVPVDSRMQWLAQEALGPYHRPQKRPRQESEPHSSPTTSIGASIGACIAADSPPINCIQAFQAELAAVIKKHMRHKDSLPTRVDIKCTAGAGGDDSDGYMIKMTLKC